MKTRRIKRAGVAFAALGITVGFLTAAAAVAADLNPVGLDLMAAPDWHGAGGNVQVHHGSLVAAPPRLDIWQRSALSGQAGDWAYVKVLIDCQQWTQLPFASLAKSGKFLLWSDADDRTKASWQPASAQQGQVIAALCGQYGYRKPNGVSASPEPGQNFVVRDPPATR